MSSTVNLCSVYEVRFFSSVLLMTGGATEVTQQEEQEFSDTLYFQMHTELTCPRPASVYYLGSFQSVFIVHQVFIECQIIQRGPLTSKINGPGN